MSCKSEQTSSSVEVSTKEETKKNDEKGTFELALIADIGGIDDKSFNQGAWEGIIKYANDNNIACKYYEQKESGVNAYLDTIDDAIKNGARLVVCPGYLFCIPVYIAQDKYPDVRFILIDGEPHSADETTYITNINTMSILYQEDQAGFLAGYAAVKDGNKKLGFLGGKSVPSVTRYGFGFIQGVDVAAKELDVNCEVVYKYTESFDSTEEAQSLAKSWYDEGTQVVFACGGKVGNSVMNAAEEMNNKEGKFIAKVIGVDVDQYSESDTVITSAMKMLSNSVYDAITMYYDGKFPGGKTTIFNVRNDGVGLAMDNAKFEKFAKSDYNEVYNALKNRKITLNDEFTGKNPANADIKLSNTIVKYIE